MNTYHNPPKLPLKLLRWYCSDERIEEIEGDLDEVFNEYIIERGLRFSRFFYWWMVIRGFRKYALKRKKMKNNGVLNTWLMFLRHNLVITWRNLKKYKTTSFINISGLAIGISSFLAIYTIIQFELSFNQGIPDAENIYRITTSYSGSFTATNRGVAIPVQGYVEDQFTGTEAISSFFTYGASVKVPEGTQEKDFGRQNQILITDKDFFDVFNHHEWLAGSAEPLIEPHRVVLEEKQARKYFGNISFLDMLDRKVYYRDSLEVSVVGVVRDPDYNHDFKFTEYISFSTIENSWLKDQFGDTEWGNTNSSTQIWFKAHPETEMITLNEHMEKLIDHVAEKTKEADWDQHYKLQALSELHYDQDLGIFDNSRSTAHKQTLLVLGIVAIFLLLIAVFNFVNLETAQSANKAKEVGVRKVMGSKRSHLVGRFLTESVFVSYLAVIISVPLAYYGLILFKEFLPDEISLNLESSSFWIFILLLGLVVGLIAGIYPSWVTSSFIPAKALKSGADLKSKSMRGSIIRKMLISFQFLFSQLLIVGTLAIVFQISFMLNKDLGFNEAGVIYFYTPWYESDEKRELMINEITKIPEITSMSLNGSPPVQNGYSTSTVKLKTEEGESLFNPHQKSGDTTYLQFYNMELVAGANFRPSEDAHELIINETFANDLGYEEPIDAVGTIVEYGEKDYTIVGVMKDFHFRSMHHPIEPLLLKYQESSTCVAMKVGSNAQIEKTIDKLTEEWHKLYTNSSLTVYFMNETVENFYKTERRASKLTSTATGIAILISCLGLIGLISFTIAQKAKEMGIRKVLGASLLQIGAILSREFIILIALSFLIATPLAYYFIGQWMTDFAYKTSISWWVYGLGGLVSLVIALVAIFMKVWKASTANPVESLRYE